MRRAVIVGLGLVTPVGIGKDSFWRGIRSDKSSVDSITAFDPGSFPCQIAAEIKDFCASDHLDSQTCKSLDRYTQFCIAAARLAMQDSGLDLYSRDRSQAGVSLGSALGSLGAATEHYYIHSQQIRSHGLASYCGSGSSSIAIDIGATGPVMSNANGCASGTMALGDALGCIRRGEANIMLAGGAEAPLYPLCFGSLTHVDAMSRRNEDPQRACRPFDSCRDGFVIGEGAAILVIEEFHHALNRGAHIYGEIVGYSLTNDAYHPTSPLPDGSQAARAMTLALHNAGLKPEDIDYVNAHGSSIPLNDRIETQAIKSVFGEHARRLVISSTKGHHAHPLGASGAIEAAACALAMERSFIPPTLNLENADSECDLDYTPNIGRGLDFFTLISNSFGFGGVNACLVMRKMELE